jgi:hypothetical protein
MFIILDYEKEFWFIILDGVLQFIFRWLIVSLLAAVV